MDRLLWTIYVQPLHRIVLFAVLLVFVWGTVGRRAYKERWWGCFNAVVFVGITAAILYMTLYIRSEGDHEVILTPFQSFIEAKEQPEAYRSMLMNVFLFVPLGLSLP